MQESLSLINSEIQWHVLKADGQIITWGDNSNGIYGIGENISTSPSRASLPEKAIAAFGGTNNIMAILMDGGVAMWGDLRQGQLGYGSDSPEYLTVEKTPVRAYNFEWAQRGAFPLSGDISEYVQVIYANGGHNDDGSYSSENLWSAGMYGAMLGRGTEHDNEILPVGRVLAGKTDVSGYVKNVILVSNGRTNSDISVITTDNGAVWAYGINENGIIGDGTTVDRYEPARVGTAYFLFDKYTYSLRVDDVEEPKRPTISSFNLLSGAEGTSTEEVELKWQTWDGSSDIVEVDSSTGKLTGKKEGTTYVIVSLADDSLTVGTFKVEVRPKDSRIGGSDTDSYVDSVAYPQVVSGTNTTYALKPNGTVWAMGR